MSFYRECAIDQFRSFLCFIGKYEPLCFLLANSQQKTGGVHWFSFWFCRYSKRKRCSMSAKPANAEKPNTLGLSLKPSLLPTPVP